MTHRLTPLGCFALVLALGCSKEQTSTTTAAETTPPPAAEAADTTAATTPAPRLGLSEPGGSASVGAPAPDFALKDLEGNVTRLSDHRGKTVVLEWFNPGCPFVQKAHTKGSLVNTAEQHGKAGVVWLAINSGAPGKQGHGIEKNRESASSFGMKHPILLDESGQVGKAYGAKHTPHMYVIDPSGVLVYRGAIDNSPDAEQQSPEGGKLVNYVDTAIADLAAGNPVSTKETDAYGCSVKYAD